MRIVFLLKENDGITIPNDEVEKIKGCLPSDIKVICLCGGVGGILTDFTEGIEITRFGYYEPKGKKNNPLADKDFEEDYFIFLSRLCYRKKTERIICLDSRQRKAAERVAESLKIELEGQGGACDST